MSQLLGLTKEEKQIVDADKLLDRANIVRTGKPAKQDGETIFIEVEDTMPRNFIELGRFITIRQVEGGDYLSVK